jgi:C1A family cysteine protease
MGKIYGMGWIPDYPDIRDYTPTHKMIAPILRKIKSKRSSLPQSVDLRRWCPPIENQGSLGSCTAQAGVALVEYYEKRAFGKHIDASRLFLYKITRNILHWKGDTGATIRVTMGAMVLFGVPPEEYWPYSIDNFDEEPLAFCYSFAKEYQSICYFRLDPPVTFGTELLSEIKRHLTDGIPSMFGFTVYDSIYDAEKDGKIPFPSPGERVIGGHAVVAVGYDDSLKIKNTKGALLVRNSWGTAWGNGGYGYLPYDYVLSGLARDFWSVLKNEWVDTGEFTV